MLGLMGSIDDATGELLIGAHVVDQECAVGYLRALRGVLPLALTTAVGGFDRGRGPLLLW
jgi:hypothetical protein